MNFLSTGGAVACDSEDDRGWARRLRHGWWHELDKLMIEVTPVGPCVVDDKNGIMASSQGKVNIQDAE